MAKGSDHIVAGALIAIVGLYCVRYYDVNPADSLVLFVSSIAGSLFPDIDVKSKGQKLFYGLMAPIFIYLFVQGQIALCFCVGLSAFLPIICRHRGLYHSWWFIVVFAGLWSTAMFELFPTYSSQILIGTLSFLCGALSHLWLDFGFWKMLAH